MNKNKTLKFTCPGCKESFEFDTIGEYEFVACPVCGANHMTIKKDQMLQTFNFANTVPTEKMAIIA